MARRHLACGLVVVGMLLCGCSGGTDDAASGDKEEAPATSQPQGE